MHPPKPVAVFYPAFGPVGDAFIAEFGADDPETTGGKPLPGVGHRVSRIDMRTGSISPLAINKSGLPATLTGGGGFERPIEVVYHHHRIIQIHIKRTLENLKVLDNSGNIKKRSSTSEEDK